MKDAQKLILEKEDYKYIKSFRMSGDEIFN